MTKQEMQEDALNRAQCGKSMTNFMPIISGFEAKGIAGDDIKPRVNVFTFAAWRAKGRIVKKGEHGVKINTFVPMSKENKKADGTIEKKTFSRPRSTTVFHVSQTEELE